MNHSYFRRPASSPKRRHAAAPNTSAPRGPSGQRSEPSTSYRSERTPAYRGDNAPAYRGDNAPSHRLDQQRSTSHKSVTPAQRIEHRASAHQKPAHHHNSSHPHSSQRDAASQRPNGASQRPRSSEQRPSAKDQRPRWNDQRDQRDQRDRRKSYVERSTAPAPKVEAVPRIDVSASPFTMLGLCEPLVQAVVQEGYTAPTPIQAQTIPHVLERRDLLGCAQTGTGKTAAFMLPILQRLGRSQQRGIRALVLSPTRELAAQIAKRAAAYSKHLGVRYAVVYGGVSQHWQERDLARKPELLVATPGRLIDLMQQGLVRLDAIEVLVLDEADTMLDMGFLQDVRRIVAQVPVARQTLLFSATMPRAIETLARTILTEPVRVAVTPQATTADTVEQSVYFVQKLGKLAALERVLADSSVERALVFTRTKHGAERLSKQLARAGIASAAIHGNKSQNARERALEQFRRGDMRVLVATDVAARGIDVQGVSHVINYDLPNVPESYVHRIGRTGRAGANGRAISFCDSEERPLLSGIERLIGKRIPLAEGSPQPPELPVPAARPQQQGRKRARFRPRQYAAQK